MATHSNAIALAETPHRINEVNPTTKIEALAEKIEALAEIICGAGEEAAAVIRRIRDGPHQ